MAYKYNLYSNTSNFQPLNTTTAMCKIHFLLLHFSTILWSVRYFWTTNNKSLRIFIVNHILCHIRSHRRNIVW